MNFIDKTVRAEMTHFYKKWVIRSKGGNNDYYNVQEYFQKYGKGNFQFETSWFYIQYKKWIESDSYVADFNSIKTKFIEDMLIGFDSRLEEIINMCDEDDEDLNKWIEFRNTFADLTNDNEKLNYLDKLYTMNYYYPEFSHLWLFEIFEDRIVSDI